MIDDLSSTKSFQQMFGIAVKSHYADLLSVDPGQIYSISMMPCLAEKNECAQKALNDVGAG